MFRSVFYGGVSVAWEIAVGSLWDVSVCVLWVCGLLGGLLSVAGGRYRYV